MNIFKNQKPLKINKIITSKRDQEIFFDLVLDEAEPNNELKAALEEYNKLLENQNRIRAKLS